MKLKELKKGFVPYDKVKYNLPHEFASLHDKYNISKCYGSSIRELIFLGYEYEDQNYIIPTYQRDLVWSLEQKQGLILSILKGLLIGNFLIAVNNGHKDFYVIDGQQRINAIREFVLNKFKIPTKSGLKTFDELDYRDRYNFVGYRTDTSVILNLPVEEQAKIYVTMNSLGAEHTTQDIEKAKVVSNG